MSHGAHAVQHEVEHHIEHDEHGGGRGKSPGERGNKKIALALEANTVPDQARRAALLKQADDWMNTVARYESDPTEKDGRKELRAQAEAYEHQRDTYLARYHHYEFASAAYQIAIVLASAAVITGIVALVYTALGLGLIGLAFMALGFFNPHYLHSLHLI